MWWQLLCWDMSRLILIVGGVETKIFGGLQKILNLHPRKFFSSDRPTKNSLMASRVERGKENMKKFLLKVFLPLNFKQSPQFSSFSLIQKQFQLMKHSTREKNWLQCSPFEVMHAQLHQIELRDEFMRAKDKRKSRCDGRGQMDVKWNAI